MRFTANLSLAVVAILLSAGGAGAQEWTRFRGPNGSGINDKITIPPVWTDKDYLWKVTLPGGGHSSPVLWGDKVFVTCANDDTANRTLLGINATNGQTVWKVDFASHTFRQHQDNSYASSTPSVDTDAIYLCWSTPEEYSLYAFDHAGKQKWKTDLGPFVSQHGGGNSPVVVGDVVLLGDDQEGKESYLFGFNRADGKLIWKLKRNSTSFSASTPVLLGEPGAAQLAVFVSRGEGVTAVDPLTGKVGWAVPKAFDARTISSPVAGDGLIFATCGEGTNGHGIVATRPPADAAGSAKIAFKIPTPGPYVPTPLIKKDLLFVLIDTGTLACYKASTGDKVWEQKIGGSFYSSPVCANDTLFVVSKKGTVMAFEASDHFKALGKTELGEKCHATPALADGCLFARTYTQLVCVKGSPTKFAQATP
jgi:outer membrane protein assembly factor BamB